LPPPIVEEGRAIARRALDTYAACHKADSWPAYGEGVQELDFKRWAYRLTEAPSLELELPL
jgi:exodeoxyribonuclease VIII